MHTILFILELAAATIAGLILIGLGVASLRACLGETNETWILSDVAAAEAKAQKEIYPKRVLAAFDVFCNVVFFKGQQDETISTHSWRASLEGKLWGKAMIWWLNLMQPNHGQHAACGDLEKAAARVSVLAKLLGIV